MTSRARRRRARFEKPPEPPAGFMYIYNVPAQKTELVSIAEVEQYFDREMRRPLGPNERPFEGYNWRSEASRKRSS